MKRGQHRDFRQTPQAPSSQKGSPGKVVEKRERSSTRVLFVDVSGEPGGGQLSAERLLPSLESIDPTLYLSHGGVVAERLLDRDIAVVVSGNTSARAFARFVAKTEPDAVVALSTAAARLVAMSYCRSTRILRLSEDMDRYKRRGWKSAVYFGFVFRMFDGFLANSFWTSTTIPRGLRHVPVRVAFPISGFDDAPFTASTPLSGHAVEIATLSRLERWKGVDLAIIASHEVQRRLPDHRVTIHVFGGGHNSDPDYVSELHALASNGPSDVIFHGHIDDLDGALASTDIVVLPSIIPEPFGQAVAQGMRAGRVVIVSDQGGALEIIENGVSGATFRSGSSEDLADTLVDLIQDPEGSQELAREAQQQAAAFRDDVTIPAFEEALLDLIDRQRSVPRRRLKTR